MTPVKYAMLTLRVFHGAGQVSELARLRVSEDFDD